MPTLAKSLFALGAVGLAASSMVSAQTTLLNNDFTNAGRTAATSSNPGPQAGPITGLDADTGSTANTNVWNGTQNDWVVASGNGSVAGATGGPTYFDGINVAGGINGASLRVVNIGAFYDLKTYFTATTIAPGESMTVSFNVRTATANPTGSNGFRIGLFNSGGSKQTANISSYGSATFNGYQGYTASFSPNATGTTTTATSVQDRSAGVAANGLFQGTLATLTNSGSPVVGGTVAFNTNYSVIFSIARSSDGLTNSISSTFAGASITATDSASPYTNFDTLSIFFGSGWGAASPSRANFIDDVTVTYSAIPEPSTYAALAGVAILGLAAYRRRRS